MKRRNKEIKWKDCGEGGREKQVTEMTKRKREEAIRMLEKWVMEEEDVEED